MKITFTPIDKENINDALAIYNWYILNSTATFHLEAISVEKLEKIIAIGHIKYQSFAIKYGNQICGFCYLSQFRNKEAYDKSAEITLYLKQGFTGKNIGKITLTYIENIAKEKGINNLVAVITEDNRSSITLFEKTGYLRVGHLKNIGEKFGETLDVVSYQKEI